MSANKTFTLSTTNTMVVTASGTVGVTPVNLAYADTARTIKKYGHDTYVLASAASGDIWPDAVGTIAAGDAIHFTIVPTYGTSDTTAANKAGTVTINAEVLKLVGLTLEFEETAATTVVIARTAGNEDAVFEVFWYVYTI